MESLPEGKFRISPDLRKGLVTLVKSDRVLHLKWTDRTTNVVQDDLTVLPNAATLKKVTTGREGDRVYVLQYTGSHHRHFFWMQDKNGDKDEDFVKKMNDLMKNPPADEPRPGRGGIPGMPMGLGDLAGLGGLGGLGGMGGLGGLGGMGAGATGASAAPAAGGAAAPALQRSHLEDALAAMGFALQPAAAPTAAPAQASSSSAAAPAGDANTPPPPPGASTPAPSSASPAPPAAPTASTTSTASAGRGLTAEDLQRAIMSVATGMVRRQPLALQEVLTGDEVVRTGVLNQPGVREELTALLPEGQRDEDNLMQTLYSPQFRQALEALTEALQGDSYASVLANLGLDPSVGQSELVQGENVRAFLQALMAAFPPRQGGEGGGSGDRMEE